jgi:hypothetical protein
VTDTGSLPMPAAPRYGEASVAELLPDALAVLGGDQPRLLPLPDGVRHVALLVVDGLGRQNLDDHARLAPTLAATPGVTVDAPFPATTATSLSCIGTGHAPGQHGITGFSLAPVGFDRALVTLTWTWDHQASGEDASEQVPPEELQPGPTVFDVARQRGVRPVTVLRPEFHRSGLTRAGLRGGDLVAASDLDATLGACLDAVDGAGGPTLVYAHHGDLDAIGHLTGPGSEAWCSELGRIDAALAGVHARLPDDAALVVTADHGMVHVPDEDLVELADHPHLLEGVRVLTGDSRARQLHVRDGAAADVLAAWREEVGDLGHVVTRDEAIDAGWFGPVRRAEVRATIGDVLAVADGSVAWVHRDADLFGGRLPGLHAGLTRREVEVPALVLTR